MVTASTLQDTTAFERLSITLSQEELYVIMLLIKAQQLPGFDVSWLHASPDGELSDETLRALEVATDALVARGYLEEMQQSTEIGAVSLGIPAPVIALVGACAFGKYSLLLIEQSSDTMQGMYLHELGELGVLHTVPKPNIHRFELLDGRTGVLHLLDELLLLGTQQKYSQFQESTCSVVSVKASRDAAQAGLLDEASELLVRGGLSAASAQLFAQAMQRSSNLGALVISFYTPDGQIENVSCAFAVTDEACFRLTDVGTTPASYHIQSVSADALRTWIVEHMPTS